MTQIQEQAIAPTCQPPDTAKSKQLLHWRLMSPATQLQGSSHAMQKEGHLLN